MNNTEIFSKLESLERGRFTKEELETRLSALFGVKVEVYEYERDESVKRDLPELDDQLMATIENGSIYIDVDLFYLVDNAGKFYITETNFMPF